MQAFYNESTGQWDYYDPYEDYSDDDGGGVVDKPPDVNPPPAWDQPPESGGGGITPDDPIRDGAGGGGQGPPNPYDPNDPHYQYGPGTMGGTYVGGGGGGGGGWGASSSAPNMRPFSDYWQPFGGMTYGGFPDFKYAEFADPSVEEAQNMPGYKFAVDEGIKRLGNERAARGTYLGGPTLKAIGSWVSDYGMQSYGNLRDQKLSTYNTNRNNAADAWMKNYGVSRDTFDRNYRSAWDSNQSAFQGAQMQFGRDWDLYNSWLQNQQFLINQGNY